MPIDPIVGGAMVNAGAGILSGIGAKRRANRQHKHNIALADHQFKQNVEMWNMQNEYNTPKNQMARMKEAGLNPNLAYGSVGTGNAANSPTYSAETTEQPDAFQAMANGQNLLGLLGMYQDVRTKKYNADMAKESAIKQRFQNTLNWIEEYMKTDKMHILKNDRTISDLEKSLRKNQFKNENFYRMENFRQQYEKAEEEIRNLRNTGAIQKQDLKLKKSDYDLMYGKGLKFDFKSLDTGLKSLMPLILKMMTGK